MNPNSHIAGLPGRMPVFRRLARLARDEAGASAIIFGLLSMVLIGFAALGTEVGYWYFTHRNMQNAADSAAMSAVTAIANGATGDYTSEAKYAAAAYGFVDTSAPLSQGPSTTIAQGPSSTTTTTTMSTTSTPTGVTVTVNKPPKSGAYTADAQAIEVIISQPQPLFLSAALNFGHGSLFSTNPTQTVRAVATAGTNGNGCVVSLDKENIGDFLNGNSVLNIPGCDIYVNSDDNNAVTQVGNSQINARAAFVTGNVTGSHNSGLNTTQGTYFGTAPINDPYANVAQPDPGACSATPNGLTPGTYCGGWSPNGTLAAGVYVVNGGTFALAGNAALDGTAGVTIVLTNGATMQMTGNASITMNPPADGPTAGISIFQDRTAVPGSLTDKIAGNGTFNVTGVIYMPTAAVTYNGNGAGGSSHCTQLIGYTVTFVGNGTFQNDCFGKNGFPAVNGVSQIGAIPAYLVE